MWTQATWGFVIRQGISAALVTVGLVLVWRGGHAVAKAATLAEKVEQAARIAEQQVELATRAAQTEPAVAATQDVAVAARVKADELKGLVAEIAKLPAGDRLVVWGIAVVALGAVIGGWLDLSVGASSGAK
ncbi:hypothetical protein LZG04_12505 [Saccharothrix sp. S26]|uniref:hypothetical protein n=1 Tax=Saccharothrix sp. S26 TaxID=2907215 RepID=UPI001F31395E|nr:hypothetical protein [Saccharothrix sp. S26]MCE6995615.1 hypothetical protein [Saccharothrix sp. S26]